MQSDLPFLVALAHFQKFQPIHLRKLQNGFVSAEKAWHAPADALVNAGISWSLAEEFVIVRNTLDPETCWHELTTARINVIAVTDPHYPALLAKIYDPPAVLFYRGTLPQPHTDCVGVVGSRLMSTYGKQVTEEITTELARTGITIVSGLALGIDGVAHTTTLSVGGNTIAVLAGGIDPSSISPGRHRPIAQHIIDSGGMVCSEYPPKTIPLPRQFPARNRIIAGLSRGVLVVEAKEKSGALITARCALEEGREVFAVPGNITLTTSHGTNWLIKQGAHPVTSAQDILEVLEIKKHTSQAVLPELTEDEALVYKYLSRESVHIDALAERTALDISSLTSTLTVMEIKGLVRNVGSQHFVRTL